MRIISLEPLTEATLPQAIALDALTLGGFWTADGYRREIESPNSDLLVLRQVPLAQTSPEPVTVPTGGAIAADARSSRDFSPDGTTPLAIAPDPQPPSPWPILAMGCAWAILEEAHITLLVVHPAYQRQGLGQAMLWALLNAAYNRQLERATLEVRVSNQAAIALYEKFGFNVAGTRKRYYQDNGEDALILWQGGLHRPKFPESLAHWQQAVRDRLQHSGWQWQEARK